LILNDKKRRSLQAINRLIANNVEDEETLANIYDLVCRYIGKPNKTEKSSTALLNNISLFNMNNVNKRKIIAVDFDGVVHQYVAGSYSGDSTIIPNPPVPGAIEWLENIVDDDRFFVVIFSSRSKIIGFEQALYEWFKENGLKQEAVNKITISATKPPAFLFIDDRNWRFNGKFPNPDTIAAFKAWHEEKEE
jgi:hypothetical protein